MANSPENLQVGLPQREARRDLFERVVAQTGNGVVITAPDAAILFVNAAFMAITGYGRDEILGRNMRMLHSGRQDKSFYDGMWASLTKQGSWSGAVWNRRKDGECYQEWLTIDAISDDQQRVEAYVGVFSDISSIRTREHILEHMAYRDTLTELPNRLLLHDRLHQSLAYAQRDNSGVALFIIDVDGVKRVNKTHGFLYGDRLLQGVAQQIQAVLGECDTVARTGGDEFGVVLSRIESEEQIPRVAAAILEKVSESIQNDDDAPEITASIGISRFPDDARNIDELLEQAALAMYASKRGGGARFKLYGSLHPRAPD
jgi:diguanylate cyclase (GGDEF)-like protein/PAS domain S-box-containing protein